MPYFDIIKETHPSDSYRVQAVIGAFDLDNAKLDDLVRELKADNLCLKAENMRLKNQIEKMREEN